MHKSTRSLPPPIGNQLHHIAGWAGELVVVSPFRVSQRGYAHIYQADLFFKTKSYGTKDQIDNQG
ncbi:MAG: hypothetical protein BA874_12770 [Desulfuromonadales bacterium C00003068]|nr:MAG: hypothetical protein BA874_12770 [Desulfuromonadales bacterium C00003068]